MINRIIAWGERICSQNEQDGFDARWDLYQGEEDKRHYENDQQWEPIVVKFNEAAAQIGKALEPLVIAMKKACDDLAAALSQDVWRMKK